MYNTHGVFQSPPPLVVRRRWVAAFEPGLFFCPTLGPSSGVRACWWCAEPPEVKVMSEPGDRPPGRFGHLLLLDQSPPRETELLAVQPCDL